MVYVYFINKIDFEFLKSKSYRLKIPIARVHSNMISVIIDLYNNNYQNFYFV